MLKISKCRFVCKKNQSINKVIDHGKTFLNKTLMSVKCNCVCDDIVSNLKLKLKKNKDYLILNRVLDFEVFTSEFIVLICAFIIILVLSSTLYGLCVKFRSW